MGGINGIFDYNLSQQQVVKPVEKVNEVAKTTIRVNKPTFQELLDGYRNPKKEPEEEKEEEKETVTQRVDATSIAASMAAMNYLISKKKEKK